MDGDSEQLARFEEMGEEAVRIHAITAGFATANQRLAIKWFRRKLTNPTDAVSPPT
jgi:hypothetical protein